MEIEYIKENHIRNIVEYCNLMESKGVLEEAEYKGKKVTLNKPMRGDVKKYKVFVKNPKTGKVIKVNFGDKNMEIRRDNPERRKSFRARHKCETRNDRTKASYWSCKFWSRKPVSDLLEDEKLLTEKILLNKVGFNKYAELVADAYEEAPVFEQEAVKHYEALRASNNVLWQRLLSKVDVVFVSEFENEAGRKIKIGSNVYVVEFMNQPYNSAEEMTAKFNETGRLYISVDYSSHPFFNEIENIMFRTIHDYIVHILGKKTFRVDGEIKAYNLHAKLAPDMAKPALFTEVVGQAAYFVTRGKFPTQKVAVLNGFDYDNVGYVEGWRIENKELVKNDDE